jgi:hypothetical protein
VDSPQVEAVQLFGEACSASAGRGNGLAIFRLRLVFVFLGDFRMRSGLENGSHGLAKIMECWLRIVPVKRGAVAAEPARQERRQAALVARSLPAAQIVYRKHTTVPDLIAVGRRDGQSESIRYAMVQTVSDCYTARSQAARSHRLA